jgi:predicted Zn-dependent protease
MFRKGDTKNAIPLIDSLIKDLPQDPYFWELKGQAYLEGGQPAKALAPLKQASKLLPNNGLIQILYAQALIATENKANAKEAVRLLTIAKKSEPDSVDVHKFSAMGYALLGDIPRAELATAQAAMALGDTALAAEKAKIVMNQFKHGTPEWFKANDIVNFTTKP